MSEKCIRTLIKLLEHFFADFVSNIDDVVNFDRMKLTFFII